MMRAFTYGSSTRSITAGAGISDGFSTRSISPSVL
jgi:hypothetical protein